MKTEIRCKNKSTEMVALSIVPGFPQLGVLCGGICADCNAKPYLRQDRRVINFANGEMIKCVPAMMVDGLEAQLAVLRIIGASAEEIESIERKIRA